MSDHSKIEWTDATWNPIRGCSRVSEGCRNCYAERQAARFTKPGQAYEGLAVLRREPGDESAGTPAWTGQVRFLPELLDQPLRWKRPRKIFVNSMSDLFHEKVPIEWVARIFNVMAFATADCGKNHKHVEECWCGESHVYQILTKRPKRMLEIVRQLPEYFSEHFSGDSPCNLAFEGKNGWPLPNVWLGVSVEDQKTADERIPLLLETPAAVRWVSYEPALGPVNFSYACPYPGDYAPGISIPHIDWLVAGGESGPGARPAHPDWFRAAHDECRIARVPFFFKQWGEWLHLSQVPAVLTPREKAILHFRGAPVLPGKRVEYLRVGKQRAGHLLDGVAWQEFPQAVAR